MNRNLEKILQKLTLSGSENTTKDILRLYEKQGYCIVHFLYFATIILGDLDSDDSGTGQDQILTKALLSGDLLLPDGIALKLLYKKHTGKELPNLNGTDFLPFFLSHLGTDAKVEIIVYGGTESVSQGAASHIRETFAYPVIHIQHGFQEFDWSAIKQREDGVIRILLVGRGSPRQEIWTEENKEQIRVMKCLSFSVGGLLDFWSGSEKRAPLWMRTMKIEWLYRALSNPKKNLKKTLVSLQLLKFLIR